ncbi:MAG: NAD(P)-binding domain-containing protein [Longimicrobiales bacterium]|nr:NAD(P)-binding domain-containing protein [Longimicrobiales bacterium]
MAESVDTIVIGAGQAGLATSWHLSERGVEHLILERADTVGSSWRDRRWDSFCLVTPNWMIDLPGFAYDGGEPDGFMPKDEVVAYLQRYASAIDAPIRFGTEVRRLAREGDGFQVTTGSGRIRARNVVVAAGSYGRSKRPPFAAALPDDITRMDPSEYRSPDALPPGPVLVVGSGQSGTQIAEELYQSGREVFMATGTAGRVPRRHAGRDVLRWLEMAAEAGAGPFADTADTLDPEELREERHAAKHHVSGRDGGHDLNLHRFARDGVHLFGHLEGVQDGTLRFARDLHENLRYADQVAVEIRSNLNGLIEKAGIDVTPEDPEVELELQDGFDQPQREALDLRDAGIRTVIWATGFWMDFDRWIDLPVFDGDGYPRQHRGVTDHPGLYFVGLYWMYSFASDLLYGVGEDAGHVADHLADRNA